MNRRHGSLPAVAIAVIALVGCTHGAEVGERMSFPEEGSVQVELLSAQPTSDCPSRMDRGVTIPGDFLVLSIEVRVQDPPETLQGLTVADGTLLVSTAPERFTAVDRHGEPVGTSTPTAWECFDDEDLLPLIMSSGMTAEGYVVLEMTGRAESIEFTVTDDQAFEWKLR